MFVETVVKLHHQEDNQRGTNTDRETEHVDRCDQFVFLDKPEGCFKIIPCHILFSGQWSVFSDQPLSRCRQSGCATRNKISYLRCVLRKYPIGLQSFRKIREGKYLYVDKTEVIHRLVTTGQYYFLSRPRRFGKSLLVDTLEELFRGNKELFEGLWIHDHWDWTTTSPVIHFNFAGLGVSTLGLEAALHRGLAGNAERLGISLSDTSYDQQFKELIVKASQAGNVVVLIDEYDKPLIDYLDDPVTLQENRSAMKNFYSVLKELDGHIRFLLLTGVSRFSRVSIFSDLNNLRDITISNPFATIAGITQVELERDFAPEIAVLQGEDPEILGRIREWYNGYTWDGKTRVYNPFSLLNYMADPVFRNYWYATGTPTFLLQALRKRQVYNIERIRLGELALAVFEVDNPNPGSLLFQTGYLTIKQISPDGIYELDYPNREVKTSLLDGLLSTYREVYPADSAAIVSDLKAALREGNVPGLVDQLNALIGTIPYDHWRADTESIFHILTVLTFKLTGIEVHTEVHSAKGRCDVLVLTDHYIYVLELKLDGTAQEALEQIQATGYLQPYAADPRKKLAVGISFSSTDRCIADYVVSL